MEGNDRLLVTCDALDADSSDSLAVQAHNRFLREGIQRLQHENAHLRAQRGSLEDQVMTMAQESEPPANWYDKVVFIFSEEEDVHPVA